MILHIPHCGTETLDRDINPLDIVRGCDWFTDELFRHRNSDIVIQNNSRFIVDCERLPDAIEPLLKSGYGICYEKDFDGNDISVPNRSEMLGIYEKHHDELNSITRKLLSYIPVVFVVDCHSFGDSQIVSDVDFCLGFNDDFENLDMLERMKIFLEEKGYTVGINNPYSNAIVPSQFYGNKNVKSIMIEVNKRLYLTEYKTKVEKSEKFGEIQNLITKLLDIISKEEQSYDYI